MKSIGSVALTVLLAYFSGMFSMMFILDMSIYTGVVGIIMFAIFLVTMINTFDGEDE